MSVTDATPGSQLCREAAGDGGVGGRAGCSRNVDQRGVWRDDGSSGIRRGSNAGTRGREQHCMRLQSIPTIRAGSERLIFHVCRRV